MRALISAWNTTMLAVTIFLVFAVLSPLWDGAVFVTALHHALLVDQRY
ncbi:MAG: hypothetical protein JO267_06570 [Alphaproteobacteria bacterium]|nr:hypothetical protein [Alphaproteobacteria bacterium]